MSISSSPPASSIWVKALMSAPAEKTIGTEEAITIAPTSPEALTFPQTVFRSRITCGGDGVHRRVGEPGDRDLATGLQLARSRPARPRRAAGRGRSPGRMSMPEAALGDEAPEDDRGREALPVLLLEPPRSARASESSPSTSAFQNGGSSPRRGSRPAPAIIPTSMSRTEQTPSSTSLQASISALAAEQRDQLLGVGIGLAGDCSARRP